jgi:hypothetical protein
MNASIIATHPARTAPESRAQKIIYTDLTREAVHCCIQASVFLESRVLEEFAELDPALGHNVAGVIFSVLACHLAGGHGAGDDRLTICLTRRSDGRPIELDLMLFRRRQEDGERFYLRVADVREEAN